MRFHIRRRDGHPGRRLNAVQRPSKCVTPTLTTTTTSTSAPPPTEGTTTSPMAASTTPPMAPPTGSRACTFDDEFDGTSLDTGMWRPVLTSTSGYESGSLLSPVCDVDAAPATMRIDWVRVWQY